MAIYDTVGLISLKQCPNPVIVYESEGMKLHLLARTYGHAPTGPPLRARTIMNNLGYNWSFKINLEDLEQLNQSHKEEYYQLGAENEFCGSTIRKQQIK